MNGVNKVAIVVLSYRMPEMTDALVERIAQVTRWPHDLFVIDNGSPEFEIARSMTHRCKPNRRLTGGFNFGIECVRKREAECLVPEHERDQVRFPVTAEGYMEEYPYSAIWFVCNDVRLRKQVDVLAACMRQIERENAKGRRIGVMHPSMEADPKTWNHPDMVWRPHSPGVRDTDWADIICPIYTREMMNVLGWQFNPELVYGWGIDRESCYLAWKNDLRVTVCDDAEVWHNMGTTYAAGKDTEFKDFEAYKKAAGGAQWPVLQRLYGDYERVFAGARPAYYARRGR